MRILIYGGSFDPIHLGHINIAKHIKRTLDIDKVYFELAKNPRWKEPNVNEMHRLKMLELAINDIKDFKIDLYELNSKEDINYSYDTVMYFKERFKSAELYFLIGYDQLDKLHKWHRIDEMSSMVQIVAYNRLGTPINITNVKRYNVKVIEGSLYDMSSTEVRNMKSFYVPKNVLRYILDNRLYFASKVQALMSDKRYNHSIEVALLAREIAMHNNVNPNDAFVAGLLHDIGKEIPKEEAHEIMNKNFKEYIDLPMFAYHQFIGAYLAKEKFKIENKEVVEAIKFHATGNSNMSALSKIIYVSDKIEPTRGFDSSDLISSCIADYDSGFIEVLSANREFLLEHNDNISNRLTVACFKEYLNK